MNKQANIKLPIELTKRSVLLGRKHVWDAKLGEVEIQGATTKQEAIERITKAVLHQLTTPSYEYKTAAGFVWTLKPCGEQNFEYRTPSGITILNGQHGRQSCIEKMIAHAQQYDC